MSFSEPDGSDDPTGARDGVNRAEAQTIAGIQRLVPDPKAAEKAIALIRTVANTHRAQVSGTSDAHTRESARSPAVDAPAEGDAPVQGASGGDSTPATDGSTSPS